MADEMGDLQRLVDEVFMQADVVHKVDLEVQARADDLCDDLLEVVALLPGGSYRRRRLCDQINSIVTAHGWGLVYGTVE